MGTSLAARVGGQDGEACARTRRDGSEGALVEGQDPRAGVTLRQDDQGRIGQAETEVSVSRHQVARSTARRRPPGARARTSSREAIEARYGAEKDVPRVERILHDTAGLWRDRKQSGEDYVEQMRTGGRLNQLYREDFTEPPGR